MLSFFKMNQLLNETDDWDDWQDFLPGQADVPPQTTPAPQQTAPAAPRPPMTPPVTPPVAPPSALSRRVVNRASDPNAELTGKKGLRYKLDPHSRSMVKTGAYTHGSDYQDVSDNDAYLNAADKRARKAERGTDVGNANLHAILTGANDPDMKTKPDFLASKILKAVESNPDLLQKGRPYSAAELFQVIRPILGNNYQPAEIIPSMDKLASLGKISPFKKIDSMDPQGKRVHGYVFDRSEGQMDDNPDEHEFGKGRYANPARRGGRGRVGTSQTSAPQEAPPIQMSASQAALYSFNRVADKLAKMDTGEIFGAEQNKITIYNQLRDMVDQTKEMLVRMGDANPQKSKELEQALFVMNQTLSRYNPAKWVNQEKTAEYKPVVKRRRMAYEAPSGGPRSNTAPRDEIDDELDAQYPHTARREWSQWQYYPV